MHLTRKAERILPDMSRLLDEIAELLPPEKVEREQLLVRLVAPKALADGWLVPQVAVFQKALPGISVRVKTDVKGKQIERDESIDLAIVTEPITASGLLCERLFDDEILPVCTAQYRDLLGLQDLHNWQSVTLLHDKLWEGDWQIWGDHAAPLGLDWSTGPRYPNHFLACEAAKQALGILMAHHVLVADALEDQSLVALSREPLKTGQSYYLVRRRGHASPAAIQLRAWLLEHLGKAKAFACSE
ncbi:LysR substrate-binding domain-containing protein [uncultured Cohaesibacter sp.]|uniref:LysR substrate-binding domain-containing protein n=1 Tax=uncultured Cohaesibacter sp. TaxID=1002546 RepID=UPI0029313964|nr:LysR substrate-binding domain-containing protein [uncultured Cohaesibacter sp.]